MSYPRGFPSWVASPEEFRSTLKLLLGLHYDSSAAFDRAWTFRYPDSHYRDLMVEITRLLPPEPRMTASHSTFDTPSSSSTSQFKSMLRELLVKAQDGRMVFDRSWQFHFSDVDRPDLMVEITYLEKKTPGT